MSDRHQIHCITFHTPACDDHQDRLINMKGPEGLDDVCPICEIERLRAVLQRIADMPVDGCQSTIPVRSIARVALEDSNENDNTDGTGVNADWLRDHAGR